MKVNFRRRRSAINPK